MHLGGKKQIFCILSWGLLLKLLLGPFGVPSGGRQRSLHMPVMLALGLQHCREYDDDDDRILSLFGAWQTHQTGPCSFAYV